MTDLPGARPPAERRAALERFAAATLPTESLEEWRYSRIEDLDLDRFTSAERPAAETALPDDVAALVAATGATVVHVGNGWATPAAGLPDGVTLEEADEVGRVSGEPDPFVTLNAALAPTPQRLRVKAGTVLTAPIAFVHVVEGEGTASFPRVVVELGANAEATVLELVSSPDGVELLTVPVTELSVGDGANLRYVHVQLLGDRAWQIALQASEVGRDATFSSTAVAIGGSYARLRTDSALAAPGGTTRLHAAYFGTGEQMHDFRTMQDHRAPKAFSDLVFKGVVANHSRSVYTGLIRVEKGASGTNALQTNRNLVLHEGAHAESVPNLEIEDNDVRCSHASAVGPVSADQRFYLESRGVPTDTAERLIAVGFLDEILDALPIGGAAAWLRGAVADQLLVAEAIEAERGRA